MLLYVFTVSYAPVIWVNWADMRWMYPSYRYDISTVYRQGRGVTLTRAHLQADLDFVTPLAPHPSSKMLKENKVVLHKVLSEQLLAEAEIVKAVFEVIIPVCKLCTLSTVGILKGNI